MSTRRVLLLTNELATTAAVASGLEANGKLADEDRCRDFRELSERLQQSAAAAALVDIDTPGALATLDALVRRFTNTRFVVLASAMDPQRLLEAMQIGARHYLLKSAIATDLSGVLHRICPDDGPQGGGAVITVLSAGGGCGATTLAINLAHEYLSAASGTDPAAAVAAAGRALLVDLDTCYGAVGPYLGTEAEYGLLDLLARDGPIDGHLVETSSVAYGDRLRILFGSGAARTGEAAVLDPARLGSAVRACASTFPVTVIDAPRVGLAAAAELIRASDATFLLFQLNVKDIRTARRMLDVLSPPGTHAGVTPVASRYAKRGTMITLAEAKAALGDVEVLTLSNDWGAAAKSLNMGKPLSETTPRSDLRREIRQLAANVAMAHAKKRQSASHLTPQHHQQPSTSTAALRSVPAAAPALKW